MGKTVMKELFDRLSSYNVFNYLLSGIVFAVLAEKFLNYSLIQQNVLIGIFFYYFIGLIISKIGCLVIEPCLKKISFLRFVSHQDLVNAANKDDKFKMLREVNNTYRSLCALFLLLLFLKLYETICVSFASLSEWSLILLIIMLLLFFLVFYKKQTALIAERIEK
jgi:hypothetical protein